MKKQLFSILLAVCMLLTMLPTLAFANTTVNTWADLAAAVGAAPTDGSETVIEIGASFNADSVIDIPAGANIVIQSAAGGPYTITRDTAFTSTLFGIQSGGKLTLKSVTLDGNAANVSANSSMVYMWGGEFTMDAGATIQNAKGDIAGNTVGVCVDPGSTMTMKAGAVIRNVENTAGGYGALLVSGTLNMEGGSVTGCKAGFGGGVASFGSITMSGGSITGNIGDHGGMWVWGTINLSGAPDINGNKKTDNTTDCNLCLGNGVRLNVGALTNPNPIGLTTLATPSIVSPVNITAASNQDWSSKFTSDNPSYAIHDSGSGNAQVVQLASRITTWAELAAAVSMAPTDGSETVLDIGANLDADSQIGIPTGANIVIQSAAGGPYTMTRNSTFDSVPFPVSTDAKLTLKDVTMDGNATNITTGFPLVYVFSGGEFTMEAGTILQNAKGSIPGNTPGVCVEPGSTMTMKTGAVIRNVENTDPVGQGALDIRGTLNIEGGSVTTCKAVYSGGVSATPTSIINISGGSITGNTGDNGGIFVDGGTINLSGAPDISGNKKTDNTTDCNVSLGSGVSITVGGLTNTTPIGVTTLDTPSAGSPVNITAASNQNWSSKFTSDKPSYAIQNSGSGSAQVVQLVIIPTGGGGGSYTPPGTIVIVDRKDYFIGTENKNGSSTTATVDQSKLIEDIAKASESSSVVFPVSANTHVTAQLVVKNIEDMAKKAMTLTVNTGKVSYNLNTSAIETAKVTAALGTTESKDIPFNVSIGNSNVVVNGATVVVSPVEFTITATYNGKTAHVDTFKSFVDRTIEITADQAKQITTGVVVEADGSLRHVPTKVTIIDGKYYAVINSLTNSTYTVIWHPYEFRDVAAHWAKNPINDMGSRMVVMGVGGDLYQPDRNMTRAEFAAIVVKALGLKPGEGAKTFADVKSGDWFEGYVKTAAQYSIITGYTDGSFGPQDSITREQAMTMIARAMAITKLDVGVDVPGAAVLAAYADSAKASGYSRTAIAQCVKTGIVIGRTATTLVPQGDITRAEVAVIVQRLLEKSKLI